jgi:hypothetical protein
VIHRSTFYFDFGAALHVQAIRGGLLVQRKLDVSRTAFDCEQFPAVTFRETATETRDRPARDADRERVVQVGPLKIRNHIAEFIDSQDGPNDFVAHNGWLGHRLCHEVVDARPHRFERHAPGQMCSDRRKDVATMKRLADGLQE